MLDLDEARRLLSAAIEEIEALRAREARLVELCRMAEVPQPLVDDAGKPMPELSGADLEWAKEVAARWVARREEQDDGR